MTQIVTQWITNCGTGRNKRASAVANSWYSQLMTSGWSQVTTTADVGDGNTAM